MVEREVGVDDSLCAQFVRIASRPSPGFWRRLAQEPAHGFGIKLVLVLEMPVEAAVRQAGILHDLADRDLGKTLAVEQAARAFEDALTRLQLVLGRIRHVALRRSRTK